jgi:hypothetical protein
LAGEESWAWRSRTDPAQAKHARGNIRLKLCCRARRMRCPVPIRGNSGGGFMVSSTGPSIALFGWKRQSQMQRRARWVKCLFMGRGGDVELSREKPVLKRGG